MARKKRVITITITEDTLRWLDDRIVDLTFGNRGHAIEKAIQEMKKKMEKNGD